IRNRQSRIGNPLECPSGGHYVELRSEAQSRRVAVLKMQIRIHVVLGSRKFEQYFVAIDAGYKSIWSNSLGNACRDCTSAAADVKHKESRLQQFGKAAVVSLKSPPTEDSRIGPV